MKGQVFNRSGHIIVNAYVEVLVDGHSRAVPPARSNEQGWYEFNIEAGRKVTIHRMKVDNRYVQLAPTDFTVTAKSGCYQLINIHQH